MTPGFVSLDFASSIHWPTRETLHCKHKEKVLLRETGEASLKQAFGSETDNTHHNERSATKNASALFVCAGNFHFRVPKRSQVVDDAAPTKAVSSLDGVPDGGARGAGFFKMRARVMTVCLYQ
jgi:hypothetical protein